ncbi:MAG: magnesium transporter [Pseudomonadota bacterium]
MEHDTQSDLAKLDERLQPVIQALERFHLLDNFHEHQVTAPTDLENRVVQANQDSELARRLADLDGADIAQLLEMMPVLVRHRIWSNLQPELAGDALSEVVGDVAEDLIQHTPETDLFKILGSIMPDEINALRENIPDELLEKFKARMQQRERRQLETSSEYTEECVGGLMKHDFILLSADLKVSKAVAFLREQAPLPEQTDKIFVRDEFSRYLGAVTMTALVLADGDQSLAEIMNTELITFLPTEPSDQAGQAFERYDLISVPVVDHRQQLMGRLTVETVMDYIRERAEDQALSSAGLSEDTDLFAPTFKGARDRWPWLAINLVTAFCATRFIAVFEDTLEQIVSLAILMPIIASIGGNTGNQTIALFIRGLALEQINRKNRLFLVRKELRIGLINGLLWGALMAVVAGALYGDPALGLVMMAAMTLNLLVAATVGAGFPLLAHRLGRDPAMGGSVVLTFSTDSMGFFIFLGLATIFLL